MTQTALRGVLVSLWLCCLFPFIVSTQGGASFNVKELQLKLKGTPVGGEENNSAFHRSNIQGTVPFPTSLLKRWETPLRSNIKAKDQEGRNSDNTKREQASLYSLIEGRYPDAKSLPSVLSSLPDSSEGRKVVQTLLDYIRNKTGYTLPASWVNMALNDSYTLLDGLSITPSEIHQLYVGANMEWGPVNYTAEGGDPRVPSGFNWPGDIDGFNVTMSNYIPSISPVGAGLWLGFFFPNQTTSLKQAKINVVTSFILNQLSDNLSLKPDSPDWFILKCNGKSITTVEGFLNEIVSMNPSASISTYVTKRIAAFFGLYVQSPEGKFYEVADPLMIATGIYSANGLEEVILPAIHSEWVIDVKTQDTSFNVVWYEGDDGIGFFPGNMYVLESWVGQGNGATVTGQAAIKAIRYMSLFGDILRRLYHKMGLWDYGYAITGVCDDACGALEILAYGSSTEYPNLMMRSFVIPEILERIGWKDRFSSYYYDLLTTVSSMPEDYNMYKDYSAPERALGTIVWPPGQEPFQCVVDGRQILSRLVDEQKQHHHPLTLEE